MPKRNYTEAQKEVNRQRARDYYANLTDKQKQERYEYNKARRLANPERAREMGLNWYHKHKNTGVHREQRLLKYARYRANKTNVPFNLTLEDIVIPNVCPVFGIPFGEDRRTSASIDRIIPELGYVKGNIQIVSQLANAMKWDSNREERIAFAKWILTSEGGNQTCY